MNTTTDVVGECTESGLCKDLGDSIEDFEWCTSYCRTDSCLLCDQNSYREEGDTTVPIRCVEMNVFVSELANTQIVNCLRHDVRPVLKNPGIVQQKHCAECNTNYRVKADGSECLV